MCPLLVHLVLVLCSSFLACMVDILLILSLLSSLHYLVDDSLRFLPSEMITLTPPLAPPSLFQTLVRGTGHHHAERPLTLRALRMEQDDVLPVYCKWLIVSGRGLVLGTSTGCVSLTTKGSGGTAHTCSGRHSQYSCELLARVPGVALHCLVHRCPGSASDPLWGS